jgi:hypothetical protein
MSNLRLSFSLGALLAATTLTDAWAAPPKADTGDGGPTFDKNAAASVLSSVDLSKCRATNAPKGDGHVLVTFAATGSAKDAVVDKGPMVGTPAAKCIAKKYRETKIPAFKGESVLVGKTFHFE